MPALDWNKAVWDGRYSWADGGEEWSAGWGNSEAQWFGTLYPRVHRLLPVQRILEIAPGYGRWTRFLIEACSAYVGIDLSAKCIEACHARFKGAPHAQFFQNDGFSLADASDGSFDFIFSFDSLVHAEMEVLESYIPQVLEKLSSGGIAFIHHSNLAGVVVPDGTPRHVRAQSVSARAVEDLIHQNDGSVIMQEMINWGTSPILIDCLTTFSRANGRKAVETVHLANPRFMDEAKIVAQFHSAYSKI
jgi:SAM-dependent methyltransferase